MLSRKTFDILSFDNIFSETDIAEEMIFESRRTGIIHNFTMDVNPGFKYMEKFRKCVQWNMMGSINFISSISFEFKKLVFFNI